MTTEEDLELSLDYRLRWFDFDRFDHIKPQAVLDILQDIATVQATSMGIGWDAMHERNVFWALVRIKYEVVREPRRFQVITASTWPHSPSKYSFQRDFEIRDGAGELLIRATSEWVLVNTQTRRLAKVADNYDGPMEFLEKRSFEEKPKKLKAITSDGTTAYETEPRFTSIDINGHVNNSYYPAFVLDAIDARDDLAIKSLQIDFRQELSPDSPLLVLLHEEEEAIAATGIHDGDEVAFNCHIELSPGTGA